MSQQKRTSKKIGSLKTGRWRPSANVVMTVAVLAVAAVIIGGAILFGGKHNSSASHSDSVDPAILRRPDSNTLNEKPRDEASNTTAAKKVTLVEFLDFQCPACAAYYDNVTRKLEQDYSDRVTFVTRNFPLDVHPLAMLAARSAEAAALQGKYPQMYHALYNNYRSWALNSGAGNVSSDQQRASKLFDSYAQQIGLNLERFHRDMSSTQVQQRIERDRADGKTAGVASTPTLFVDGTKFDPSGNSFADVNRELRKVLDKELAK